MNAAVIRVAVLGLGLVSSLALAQDKAGTSAPAQPAAAAALTAPAPDVSLDMAYKKEFAFLEAVFPPFDGLGFALFGKFAQFFVAFSLIDEGGQPLFGFIELFTQLLAFAQAGLNDFQQFVFVERLGDIIVGAEVHTAAEVALFGLCREEDKRYIGRTALFAEDVEHAEAVEVGHHHVAEYEVGWVGKCFLDADLAIFSRGDLIAGQFQDLFQVFPDLSIIFDH